MKLKLLALACVMGALSINATAQAKTYNLGTLVDGETKTTNTTNYTKAGTYTDTFNFVLKGTFDSYFTGAYQDAGKFDVSLADVSIYTKAGKLLASTGAYNPTKVVSPTLEDYLTAGSYYVTDTFTVPKGKSSSYSLIATTISAAPEPASWALMFMGVAMVGGTLRYGRRFKAAQLSA